MLLSLGNRGRTAAKGAIDDFSEIRMNSRDLEDLLPEDRRLLEPLWVSLTSINLN
jgi:hypothetical protein